MLEIRAVRGARQSIYSGAVQRCVVSQSKAGSGLRMKCRRTSRGETRRDQYYSLIILENCTRTVTFTWHASKYKVHDDDNVGYNVLRCARYMNSIRGISHNRGLENSTRGISHNRGRKNSTTRGISHNRGRKNSSRAISHNTGNNAVTAGTLQKQGQSH